MRRLFWRIFALFWTATFVLILAIAWTTVYTFGNERIPGLGVTRRDSALDEQLRGVSQALRSNGLDALREVRRGAKERSITLYVLDAEGRDLFDGEIHRDILAKAAADSADDKEPTHTDQSRVLDIALPDGARYTAIAAYLGHPMLRIFYRPWFWDRVVTGSVISTVFSLILAAYVASPLSRIRASARRVAGGDLDARVGALRFGRSTEMLALASEFDEMAARLKDLVEDQRRLIRDVSHEMRSPLARQRVAIELARSQIPEGDARRMLERIERESERLEEMIVQTIQLSRMGTTTPSQAEPLALDALVADIVADAAFEAQVRHCSLLIQQSTPIEVRAETDLLYSAIENIVRNAVNYTRADSAIRIRLDRVEREARLRVIDAGPGVPEADLARIFEPYFRTDEARARKSGGSGLGLAIAKRAIERQGGSVRARNVAGGGLEVEILLPLA